MREVTRKPGWKMGVPGWEGHPPHTDCFTAKEEGTAPLRGPGAKLAHCQQAVLPARRPPSLLVLGYLRSPAFISSLFLD